MIESNEFSHRLKNPARGHKVEKHHPEGKTYDVLSSLYKEKTVMVQKKIVRRELGRDGKILTDHRQDSNDEAAPQKKRKKKEETEMNRVRTT